jgi:hypothetical protein
MPDPSDDTASRRSSPLHRYLWWAAGALGVVALVAGTLRVVRSLDAKDDPLLLCQSLENAGAVDRCALQRSPIVYGVRAEQVVRFEVKYAGHRAYLGTLARLRDEEHVRQFLRFASEADRKSARKTAAAAEIGSRGKLSGVNIMDALAPVQIANLGRCTAVDLKPVYGGPQQAAAQQVETIRARVMQ